MMQCYLAGRYSAPTLTQEIQNIYASLKAGCALAKAGWKPVIPHVAGSHMRSWDEAMDDCRAVIRSINPSHGCMVMLPGWEDSRGAVEERELALSMDLPVMTLEEALGYEVTP